ncbi:hypothetical protein [Mesorhizobium sp. J428]|uniref:hypothetical protein n=1 Tax=Mesorhizobium sp. J428 TaxID=2898440 RepID=UPI002151684A|nr:hypothetical protein [Mesorhizobium sp. J428]MCR5856584.1 hypothetical protein [Mesorhizobium sp. J428]
MSHRNHMQGARASQRLRERMARTGNTAAGQPLWTDDELNVCRELFPDRKAIYARLQRRSPKAIQHKCEELGLAAKRVPWMAADIVRLRKLFRSASWDELLAAFPGRTELAIRLAAGRRGIRRAKKPYKLTGYALLDQLRAHCFEKGISMPDLDLFARSGTYFQKSGWHHCWYSVRFVTRAVEQLDGIIKAEWRDAP